MDIDSNFVQVDNKKNIVVVKINPKLYPVDILYTAAYSLMEKAYVIFEGSLQESVYAILKPRNFKGTLEELGNLFYEELTAAAFYAVQLVRNQGIREALLKGLSDTFSFNESDMESEEDIGKLWEERFGDGNEGRSEEKE